MGFLDAKMPAQGSTSKVGVGRTIIAVIASYATFVFLVVATELPLSRVTPSFGSRQTLPFFVSDLIIQCLFTIVAGYLCCLIARGQRIAIAALIGIGLLVGAVSLVMSWKSEPHWYAIGLYISYAPCLWVGWALRNGTNGWSLRRETDHP